MSVHKSIKIGLLLLFLCFGLCPLKALDMLSPAVVVSQQVQSPAVLSQHVVSSDNDTMYAAFLRPVYVYPKMTFKNKRQERFYWKTVRDVKKTLPYARLISKDMAYADQQLALLTTKKERKRWWRQYEKQLFRKYEKDFRNMYASQGQMLMKLMDRESEKTSYELIRQYRGKASADFWQFVAKLFKNDLKEGYDGADKDRIIERVITLVEAGQL